MMALKTGKQARQCSGAGLNKAAQVTAHAVGYVGSRRPAPHGAIADVKIAGQRHLPARAVQSLAGGVKQAVVHISNIRNGNVDDANGIPSIAVDKIAIDLVELSARVVFGLPDGFRIVRLCLAVGVGCRDAETLRCGEALGDKSFDIHFGLLYQKRRACCPAIHVRNIGHIGTQCKRAAA